MINANDAVRTQLAIKHGISIKLTQGCYKYTGMKSLKLDAKFVLLFTILTFFQIILEPRDIKFMIG